MADLIPINPQPSALTLRPENEKLESHHFEMGKYRGLDAPMELNEEQLATHSCVLGATGSGKSKFLELLMRYLIVARRGLALIDPHGDLSEDLLAFAAYLKASKKDRGIVDRLHYLEPSFERIFSFDPFRFQPSKPIPPEYLPNAHSAWLRAKVDRIAEVFQRKQNQASFEGMPRLQRVLTDVLLAAGTTVNEQGDRLSIADAMTLFDVKHPHHAAVYARIRPFLEPEIAADFDRIVAYKSEEQRLRETESTINRLRSLLSPIVKAIFAQQSQSLDFRSIVQNGHILLVNLRETEYFSADQRRALGGLFIHEILSTAQNEDRESRKPFYLFIDEAADFIGEDIQSALGTMRKFKLSICLAAQDLTSFKKGELDLRSKVLSQCGTKICFNQAWPDDLDILSRVFATGNLDFNKHYNVVDRPDGYDWIEVDERSESTTDGENWGKSTTTTSTTTKGTSSSTNQSRSSGSSVANGSSQSMSQSTSRGSFHSTGSSRGSSTSQHKGESRSQTVHGNDSENISVTRSESKGLSAGQHRSESESSGLSEGHTRGTSTSESVTFSQSESNTVGSSYSDSVAESSGTSASDSVGGSRTTGETISHRKIPLARYREEYHEQPSLKVAVSDQFEFIKKTIHSLRVGEAIVKLRNEAAAVVMQTCHVKEHWARDKFAAIARMKELCQAKPYFAIPDYSPSHAEDRIQKFASGDNLADEALQDQKTASSPFLT